MTLARTVVNTLTVLGRFMDAPANKLLPCTFHEWRLSRISTFSARLRFGSGFELQDGLVSNLAKSRGMEHIQQVRRCRLFDGVTAHDELFLNCGTGKSKIETERRNSHERILNESIFATAAKGEIELIKGKSSIADADD